jgi:hypothetical protein
MSALEETQASDKRARHAQAILSEAMHPGCNGDMDPEGGLPGLATEAILMIAVLKAAVSEAAELLREVPGEGPDGPWFERQRDLLVRLDEVRR